MQKISTQQLVERMKSYREDMKRRMEDKQPITVDLGSEDGTVEFYIDNMIDFGEFKCDECSHRFDLMFNRKSVVSIYLNTQYRRIELVVDTHLVYGSQTGIQIPLIVSYSDQEEGKMITLRPRKYDDPKMSEADVLLAETLFNEVTSKLGLVPETPFDFTPIRTYVRKYEETHSLVMSIWGDLAPEWHRVSEAWDNNLFEY